MESQRPQAPVVQLSSQEICQRLNEQQLISVQGAGWPLGLEGIQREIAKTGGLVLKDDLKWNRSRSAPGLLQGNILTPWTGKVHNPTTSSSSGDFVKNGK